MSDGESLLAILALIYLSDCVVWLRKDAVAVVLPHFGRAAVRRPSAWAGNDRGGFAFISILPARAVFVSEGSGFAMDEIARRVTSTQAQTRLLRALAWMLFVALFGVAPLLTWRFGFARIGLTLIAAFVVVNAVMAIVFFRTHRRIDPDDAWHRWTHAIVMLVATPSAVRAIDQATRHALRESDPLAVAAQVAGSEDRVVKTMLRELAHPIGDPDRARLESARKAGLVHREEPPPRVGDASAYCPRCLALYIAGTSDCADCELALRRF
ncbi:MAG TPA: hypothetical protein VN181_07150 [Thermoanaerobaculia bacterium]|nr:hypothetical protein [Thermoanaerobaculia bacterium]